MSVNKIILLGNVGSDPEIRVLGGGAKVATLSLATTERGYTSKDGKNVPDRTEWHSLVLWRGLSEIAEKYIKKGDKIYVEGKIRTQEYEKDGIKKHSTKIVVDVIDLLSPKPNKQPSHQMDGAQNNDLPF